MTKNNSIFDDDIFNLKKYPPVMYMDIYGNGTKCWDSQLNDGVIFKAKYIRADLSAEAVHRAREEGYKIGCDEAKNKLAVGDITGKMEINDDLFKEMLTALKAAQCGLYAAPDSVLWNMAYEAIEKAIEKAEARKCSHEGYSFKEHGRCCPHCGEFLTDFGD